MLKSKKIIFFSRKGAFFKIKTYIINIRCLSLTRSNAEWQEAESAPDGPLRWILAALVRVMARETGLNPVEVRRSGLQVLIGGNDYS